MRMSQDVKLSLMALVVGTFLVVILCAIFYNWGMTNRKTYITIKYENAQQDIYIPLKQAGIELSPEQQKDFENAVKRNHRTVGFR